MQTDRKTEILVGMFMLVGLATMAMLILRFGKVRDYFKGSYTQLVQFSDATGLRPGVPVSLGGQRIGKVKSDPVLDRRTFTSVTVELEIFEQFKIPPNSRYEIATSGLMGDNYIAIRPAPVPPKLTTGADGQEVIVGEEPKGLSNLAQTAEQLGKKVDLVLEDVKVASGELKAALTKVNTGALSDKTLEEFRSSVTHLESVLKHADEEVLGAKNKENLAEALANLREATTRFKNASGNVDDATKKLGPVIDKIDPAIAKFEKAMATADATLLSFKQSGDNLAIFTRDMAKGDGLFKALLLDKELRENFKALVANLKEHGILFYRDDAEKQAAEAKLREAQERQRRNMSPLRGPGR